MDNWDNSVDSHNKGKFIVNRMKVGIYNKKSESRIVYFHFDTLNVCYNNISCNSAHSAITSSKCCSAVAFLIAMSFALSGFE